MQLFMQNRIDARTHSNAHCELVDSEHARNQKKETK